MYSIWVITTDYEVLGLASGVFSGLFDSLRSEPLWVARVAFAISELGDRKRIRT